MYFTMLIFFSEKSITDEQIILFIFTNQTFGLICMQIIILTDFISINNMLKHSVYNINNIIYTFVLLQKIKTEW